MTDDLTRILQDMRKHTEAHRKHYAYHELATWECEAILAEIDRLNMNIIELQRDVDSWS